MIWGLKVFDVLLWMAVNGDFRPIWSAEILEEVRRNQAEKGHDVSRRLAAMEAYFLDASVPRADWEAQLDKVPARIDPGDHHVVAAARARQASLIITNNLKHFPAADLATIGIRRMSLCDFLAWLWEERRDALILAIAQSVRGKTRPKLTIEARLRLMAEECPGAADMESHIAEMEAALASLPED